MKKVSIFIVLVSCLFFTLITSARAETLLYSFVHLTDTQTLSRVYPQTLNETFRYLESVKDQYKIGRIILTGDIVDNGNNSIQWNNYLKAKSLTTIQVDEVAGNHELTTGGNVSDWIGFSNYSYYIGSSKEFYYDIYGDFLFIFISWPNNSWTDNYLTETQKNYFRNILSSNPGKIPVFCTHFYSDYNTNHTLSSMGETIYSEFIDRPVNIVLTGHVQPYGSNVRQKGNDIIYEFNTNWQNKNRSYIRIFSFYDNGMIHEKQIKIYDNNTGPVDYDKYDFGMKYDYIIFRNDSSIYAINTSTNSVDFQSSNATDVIQNSIDSSRNVGSVFIENAIYNVTMIRLKNDTKLASNGAVLRAIDDDISPFMIINLAESVPTFPVLYVLNSSNVTIEGIAIDGGNTYRTYRRPGILVYDSQDVLIKNCSVYYTFGVGIWSGSSGSYNVNDPKSSTLKTKRVTVENCKVHDTLSNVTDTSHTIKGFGIDFWYTQDSIAKNNFVYNGNESLYRTHYARDISFINNTANRTKLIGEPFDIYRSSNILIKNNTIEDNDAGVWIYEYLDNVTIESNFIKSGSVPIRLSGMGGYQNRPMTNIDIRGNDIYGGTCILLRQTNLTNFTIFNNTIHGGISLIPNSSFETKLNNIIIEKNLILPAYVISKPNELLLVNVTDAYLKNNQITNNYIKLRFSNYTKLILDGFGLSSFTNQNLNITVLEYFNSTKVKFLVEGPSGADGRIQLNGYTLKPSIVRINTTNLTENKDWVWHSNNNSFEVNFTIPI